MRVFNMQRLDDICGHDLNKIMTYFRDVTKETTIQCGSIKHTLYASLQGDKIDFTADISPQNAYALTIYYIDPQDAEFTKRLTKNAIIFVDGVSFKIIDSNVTKGLGMLSIERHKGR